MWTIVSCISCIPVRINLMMSREKSIKSDRKGVSMIGIHETSYNESINVLNILEIKIVEQGRNVS